LAEAWQRLRARIRQEGLAYALQEKLLRSAPLLVYANCFRVFVLPVDALPAAAPAHGGAVREATRHDAALLAVEWRSRALAEERFERGGRAWVMESAGRLAGHAWLTPEGVLSDYCLWLSAGPGDIWSLDGWVDPARRGEGLYNRIKATAAAAAAESGYRRLVSRVDCLNRNSLRANRAIGSREVARGWVVRLLGVSLVVFRGRWRLGCWTPGRPLRLAAAG